ncbi:retrovirus-related pol polyprotein from transposon TNT 1-94 [Tanacetum coccineum]
MKGKSVETKFEKPLVIRQSNAFKSQRQSVLVAAESTNQKPKSIIRKQYEQISKTCRWWYCKITPAGYKWKPKSRTVNVEPNVSMHLGTKSRTTNISEPMILRKSNVSNTPSSSNSFTARRDNFIHRRLWVLKAHDGKSQASKVYYVEGLNHNLFSVGQFCDTDLEVAFQKSTCYIRDLKGNDLITGSRGTYLYSITLQDTSTPNPICLMAKDSSSQGTLLSKEHTRSPETLTTSNEMDLLFSLMFNELLNGTTQVVSKSSGVTTVDAPNQRQQQNTNPSTSTIVATNIPPLNIQTTNETTKQVIGNPSQSIRTRRQLETDGEMCMFALIVSQTELKNSKEAIANSALIEAMHEEIHQFDRLDMDVKDKLFLNGPLKGRSVRQSADGCVRTTSILTKVYRLNKAFDGLKQAPKAWYDELSEFLVSKGFSKGSCVAIPCDLLVPNSIYKLIKVQNVLRVFADLSANTNGSGYKADIRDRNYLTYKCLMPQFNNISTQSAMSLNLINEPSPALADNFQLHQEVLQTES